ncbi:MAG: hypothetical protein ACTHK4_17805 [Mycobacteriales bacterium]
MATVLGVTGAVAAGPPVSAGTVQPRTSSSGWTQLSSGTIDIIQNVGLARFGSSIQAAWVQNLSDGNQTLDTRTVGSDGAPTSSLIAAQSEWGTLNEFPAVFGNGGQRVIAFSGIQDTNSSNPYSQGYEYYLTSADGTTWELADATLSQDDNAYGSYGTDAVDGGGTPVTGFTSASAGAVSYHSGFVTPIPSASTADATTTPDKCCAYYTGLGHDATSGQTWAVWYSNSGDATTNGVLAQRIEPSLGPQVQAPGSNVISNGSSNSLAPIQRYVTADRVGGGVYAGYFVGYPTATKVALWKLGSATALMRSAGGSAQAVGAAAGPSGRLWLYWWDGGTATIHAVRTNPASTRFGAVCSVTTPNKTEGVWDLVGNGDKGPLQLFSIAGEPNAQVYDTVVLPCLSVGVSPKTISASKGGTFTVTVTDAGAAIRGATVTFAGHHKTTNSSGKVSFSIAKHHAKGHFPISVSEHGYQKGSAGIRVH